MQDSKDDGEPRTRGVRPHQEIEGNSSAVGEAAEAGAAIRRPPVAAAGDDSARAASTPLAPLTLAIRASLRRFGATAPTWRRHRCRERARSRRAQPEHPDAASAEINPGTGQVSVVDDEIGRRRCDDRDATARRESQ